MARLLFLICFYAQFAFASGFEGMWEFLEGEHGYYEVHQEALPLLMDLIEEQAPSKASVRFKVAYQRSKRPEFGLGATYEVIKNAYYRTRGAVPALQGNAPISNPSASPVEMIEDITRFLSIHGPEQILAFKNHLEHVTRSQKVAKMKYDAYTSTYGPFREGTLRNFINKAILGITRQPKLEGAQELFDLMKASGFVTTGIDMVEGYRYSQKQAAKEFLQNHEEIHTLVLACGNFIPYTVSYAFSRRSEGGCGSCKEGHHISKGEMTVTLFDRLAYIDEGEDADYNEEGSSSDIIADITHPSFWEGVLEGLGGRKLRYIKEHNMHTPTLVLPRIGTIKEALDVGGVFETLCPSSSTSALREAIKILELSEFLSITTQDTPERYITIRATK